jgi:hypothetical protein
VIKIAQVRDGGALANDVPHLRWCPGNPDHVVELVEPFKRDRAIAHEDPRGGDPTKHDPRCRTQQPMGNARYTFIWFFWVVITPGWVQPEDSKTPLVIKRGVIIF